MASTKELRYHFNSKKDAKKFFYVYENIFVNTKTEEEKTDNLVVYLQGEEFESYSLNFT